MLHAVNGYVVLLIWQSLEEDHRNGSNNFDLIEVLFYDRRNLFVLFPHTKAP